VIAVDNEWVSGARRPVGDLVDDPGWMPSLLLVWIGLVGTPLVLTELQVFETLPLIVAFGWVWLTFLAGSALSGTENWVAVWLRLSRLAEVGLWCGLQMAIIR
jgi:hypothetical protein